MSPLSVAGSLIQMESATIAPGEMANVAIMATVPTTASLNAFTIHIEFDPTIAEYSSCNLGSSFIGVCNQSDGDGAPPDVISFSAVNPTGVNGAVELGNITFSGIAAGTSSLHIEVATWSDGAPSPPVTIDGQLIVQSVGTETPTPTNTPVPTATNTPVPTATNTPTPTATNTPVPTSTNTPVPTATNTPVPTATNTPEPSPTMHVGDLDGSSFINGNRWNAYVLITIHDASENPVANATVYGLWSNGATGSGICVTNGSGQCTVSKNNIRGTFSSVIFTVNDVAHGSHIYQPGNNHDPDGDSDGTAIEVFQNGPTPTTTPTPSPGVAIHAGDLDGSGTVPQGNGWSATVTITVHNAEENPIVGAMVSGSWNNGAFGGDSCVTNALGQCSITKNNIRPNITVLSFTVDNVTSANNAYDPGANHDPDGDSNGTTISVSQS